MPIDRSRVPGSVRPGAHLNRRLAGGVSRHGGGPEEAGEFAGDSNGGDVAGFAALAEALVEAVQAPLGTAGDLDDVAWLPGAALGDYRSGAGAAHVLPGGLDEEPAGVAGAGLRDRALAAALAGLVEGRDKPEP